MENTKQTHKKSIKTSWGIIIILSAAVLAGVLILYYAYGNQLLDDLNSTSFWPAKVPLSQNQITDWKTYTNSQYGFGFEYPSDWKLIKQTPLNNTIPAGTQLFFAPPNYIDDYVTINVSTSGPVQDSQKIGKLTKNDEIDNLPTYELIQEPVGNFLDFWTEKGGNYYELVFSSELGPTEQTILSTFKFAK